MTRKTSQEEIVKLFAKFGMKPLEKYVNSQTPIKSLCLKCDNEIFPRADKVKQRGHQCGYCSGWLNTEERALLKLKELGHKPLSKYPGAVKPWKMQCGGCGKTISPKYNSLQQGRWGCGFCGHKKAGAKKRELGSKKAIALLKEAGLKPLVPYPGNNVPWKSRCTKCDSLVQPRLGGIQSGQGGCVKCGIVKSAKTRMYTPSEAKRIAQKKKLQPLEPYRGSQKKWKCKCLNCGKTSSPEFAAIRDGKYGCLWCAKKIVDPGEARKKMLKAKLEPLVAYPGSDVGWLCRCMKCKREVSPAYGSIRSGQGGCRWCADQGATIDPVVAVAKLLALGIQPLEPFKTSHAKWKSQCLRCQNKIQPSYHDINQGSGGCKFCSPNFVNLKKIMEVMKKAGLEPLEKYSNSKNPWKVKHDKCGRTFKVVYANLRGGSSCRYCAGKAVIPSEAVAIMEKYGMKPLAKYPGAKKSWKCRCQVCKRTIYPSYGATSSRGHSCPYCSGNKVDPKDAVKLMKLNSIQPLVPFPGAVVPWKSKCTVCLRVVTPRYTAIRSGQGGCKYCANWGIDYAGKGFLYLMTNDEFGSHKIGITGETRNLAGDRIKKHEKSGWKLFRKLEFETADQAFLIEQAALKWLRDEKRLPAFLSEFELPQGGYTETVDASEIDLATIWAKVEELSKVNK